MKTTASFIAALFFALPALSFAAVIGNTSIGNSFNNLNHNPASGDNAVCYLATAAQSGTLDSISGYFSGSGTNQFSIWNATGSPNTLLTNATAAITVSGTGWATSTFSVPPTIVSGNAYCIGYTSGTLSTNYFYSSSVNTGGWTGKTTTDALPTDLHGVTTNAAGDGNPSFYATYSVIPPTPTSTSSTTAAVVSTDEVEFMYAIGLFILSVPFWDKILTLRRTSYA